MLLEIARCSARTANGRKLRRNRVDAVTAVSRFVED